MIELLLQAERALAVGLVDQAERLYVQAVAADPRNSIAVVGLARVALERADDGEAYRRAKQALAIDPENVAAARLADRLEEVYAHRGQAVPGTEAAAVPMAEPPEPEAEAAAEVVAEVDAEPVTAIEPESAAVAQAEAQAEVEAHAEAEAAVEPEPAPAIEPASVIEPAPAIEPASVIEPEPEPGPATEPPSSTATPPVRRSLLDRLLGRHRA